MPRIGMLAEVAPPPVDDLPEPLTGAEIQALLQAHGKVQSAESGEEQRNLRWYQGRGGGPATDGNGASAGEYLETNYPYAYVDTMVSNVVPPNPAVTVVARNPDNDQAARNREGLVGEVFRQNKMHERLWQAASLTSIIRRAFVKLAWDRGAKRARVRVIPKQFIYFDEGAESWEDIGYIIEAVPLMKTDFERRVKNKTYDAKAAKDVAFSAYPTWARDGVPGAGGKKDDPRDVFKWTVVYEVYDLRGRQFYHVLPNVTEPLFSGPLPYRWLDNPFALLTFTDDLESLGGIADTSLIAGALNQLNECQTLDLNHFKTSFQVLIINSNMVRNPDEIKRAYLRAGEPGAVAIADIKEPYTVQQALMFTPMSTAPLNTSRLKGELQDMIAFTLAMAGYQRGNVGESEVATAYALTDAALRTRNGRRQKKVYDIVAWAARGIVGLYEEFMAGDQTLYARLAGRADRVTLTRNSLGFVGPAQGGQPLEFDYDVVPYSALESNKLVQTKQIEQFWPALQWGVSLKLVDPKALMVQVLDLVGLQNVGAPQTRGRPAPQIPLPPLSLGSASGGTKGVAGANAQGTPVRAPPIPGLVGGPGDGGSQTE